MKHIAIIAKKIANRLKKFANSKEHILDAKIGSNCIFTDKAKIYNHSGNADAISIGNGVTIDGILEVYSKGFLVIDDYTFFGNSRIYCANKVTIGTGCWIADHVFIMDSDLHPLSPSKRLKDAKNFSKGIFPDVYENIPNAQTCIGNSVWIGVNSTILKGVTIGDGAIIGAGSVVTKDVSPWTVVAGNPARIIREIPEHER
jgi:acetyltransferase-like isoleucine patch superfamily enzyme